MKFIPYIAFIIFLYVPVHADLCKTYSMLYQAKRMFGPSSDKRLATMSQQEKDDELIFYAQKEVPEVSIVRKKYCPKQFSPVHKQFPVIIYLLEHGACPNIDVPYRWQVKISGQGIFKPIYLFIAANDLNSTHHLLKLGARVDMPIINQIHPLMFAKTRAMADLLIDYGARIGHSLTPLLHHMSDSSYDADLIPLYLSYMRYVEDIQTVAQEIMDRLLANSASYKDKQAVYEQKKLYLIEAGAIAHRT